jgi:FkbM family methyltransferase
VNTGAAQLPYTAVVPTVFGQMLIHRSDTNQSDVLFRTGQPRDYEELLLVRSILEQWGSNLTVVDAGAHFGAFSLGMLPVVGATGKIHAFEPQRIIFNMLAGTVALNAIENLYCHNVALGNREGLIEIPQFNYSEALSFGSIEFGPEQREPLSQERRHDPSRIEHARLTTIDRFDLGHVDLIKIDAEGMDLDIVLGGQATIEQSRPLLFVETIKIDRPVLRDLMAQNDYLLLQIGNDDLYIPRERRTELEITSRD